VAINLNLIKNLKPEVRLGVLAALIFLVDQTLKLIITKTLEFNSEKIVVTGFLKIVYWGNTGAAWSILSGNNGILAVVGFIAVVAIFLNKHHFDYHTVEGQISLGLVLGGILGNLTDRLFRKHVVDFVYFYVIPRGGREVGFPAFNVADMAICLGVFYFLVISLKKSEKLKET
jgi:signal peptidase II